MVATRYLALADDETLVAEGIGALLRGRYGEVDVVADGAALFELATSHRPDLVLTDIAVSGVDGLEVTRLLRAECPALPVIVLARQGGRSHAMAALRAGARGFLPKSVGPIELFRAVDHVLGGQIYVAPSIVGQLMGERWPLTVERRPEDAVTPRELEVAGLVARGLETVEIAGRLGIAEVTVRTHLSRTLKKLGLRNRIELTRHVLARQHTRRRPEPANRRNASYATEGFPLPLPQRGVERHRENATSR